MIYASRMNTSNPFSHARAFDVARRQEANLCLILSTSGLPVGVAPVAFARVGSSEARRKAHAARTCRARLAGVIPCGQAR